MSRSSLGSSWHERMSRPRAKATAVKRAPWIARSGLQPPLASGQAARQRVHPPRGHPGPPAGAPMPGPCQDPPLERCRGDHFVRVAELVCTREAPPKETKSRERIVQVPLTRSADLGNHDGPDPPPERAPPTRTIYYKCSPRKRSSGGSWRGPGIGAPAGGPECPLGG